MSNPQEPDPELRDALRASLNLGKTPDSGFKPGPTPADLSAMRAVKVERITLDNVREAFTYAAWDDDQANAGKRVTEAMIEAARVVLANVPESPLRTRAINGLFDARMLANAAITHRGKF